MDDATERPTPSLAAGLLLVPVVVVWAWFIQDDGFISFRYARNLALGHGLVWAPGSSEYGYTNFLYTLAMAPWIALGVPVRVASGLLTSAGFVALLGAVWTLVRDAVPDPSGRQAGIAAVTAVGVHYSVAAYASGGMETSIAAAFVAWAWVMALRASDGITWRTTLPMGLFAAGALLTRLDTCLLLAPAYAVLLATVRRHGGAAPWAAAAAIPTAAVIALLAWAYATYGQLLPTSFYAKTGHGIVVQHGISYLIAYALAEWIALGVIGWLVWQLGRRGAERTARASLLLPVGVEVAWLLYIGGDFMEFRFLVPVVALAYAWLAIQLGRAAWTGGLQVFVVGAFASTAWHGGLYSPVALRFLGVESVHFLSHWVDAPAANWTRTGKRLGERFDHGRPDDVHIALIAAGAIPYYSNLPTTDQLLLNSKGALPSAVPFTEEAGHRVRASSDWVHSQGVNLILSEIWFDCLGDELVRPDVSFPLRGVAIPVGGDCSLLAYYDHPHPDIEAGLAEGTIVEVALRERD